MSDLPSIILRDANDTLYLAVRTQEKTHSGAPLWTLAIYEDREPTPAPSSTEER